MAPKSKARPTKASAKAPAKAKAVRKAAKAAQVERTNGSQRTNGAGGRTNGRNGRTKTPKTAMLLAQRIVGEIADRGLEPGSALPPEREMLEEYGVARGTLREALRFLEIQGVIRIKTGPGGGPTVDTPSFRPLASTLSLLLLMNRTPFRAVLESRMLLEPALAAKAATRISAEALEELHDSVQTMREHIDDIELFLDENQRFHSLIAEAADNDIFQWFIDGLNWITDATPLGVEYSQSARETVAQEHQRIYQAIREGDAERASLTMGIHVRDFAAYLQKFYPRVIEEPLRWDRVEW